MADILDWTNSSLENLDMASFEARAEEMAVRLREETGAGKLPFLTMPYATALKKQLEELKPFLKKFDHMLLLGIGGSALGARALQQAFFPQQNQPGHSGPSLWIADNVDAYALEAYLAKLPPEKNGHRDGFQIRRHHRNRGPIFHPQEMDATPLGGRVA